jgi:hypothetical protein
LAAVRRAEPGSDAVEMMPDGERIVAERQQVHGQQDRNEPVPEIPDRAGGMEPALRADARTAAGSARGIAALRSGRMRSGHRTSKVTEEGS